jgi:hypothetical protein
METVSRVDEYCIQFEGHTYIREATKDISVAEKKKRRAVYMVRYRAQIKKKKRENAEPLPEVETPSSEVESASSEAHLAIN